MGLYFQLIVCVVFHSHCTVCVIFSHRRQMLSEDLVTEELDLPQQMVETKTELNENEH